MLKIYVWNYSPRYINIRYVFLLLKLIYKFILHSITKELVMLIWIYIAEYDTTLFDAGAGPL